MDDTTAMERCIELARAAAARGDQPYGSVVVLDGRIVAEADNSIATDLDPTAHAELVAIRRACQALGRTDLAGATIYASGEPCWMCSTLIRQARLSRVVFAMPSSSGTGGATSAFNILRAEDVAGLVPPPEVVGGFLEERVRALHAQLGWPPRR
ncbi:MAG TPA: nucleoside deaminase [Thermomicrobiales bacterium]|nr:nucleoside deaminase [Thermomicrobiales bacterium]